jgi:hypothetical protein
MDTIRLVLEAAWKVLGVGLLLGAGLPAVFALGVRALAGDVGQSAAGDAVAAPTAPRRLFAVFCFAVVLIGVAIGLLVIVAAGSGKAVSFEHLYPTLEPKP